MVDGWGARIRTWEWRYQKPLPYHLATPQLRRCLLKPAGGCKGHSQAFGGRARPLSGAAGTGAGWRGRAAGESCQASGCRPPRETAAAANMARRPGGRAAGAGAEAVENTTDSVARAKASRGRGARQMGREGGRPPAGRAQGVRASREGLSTTLRAGAARMRPRDGAPVGPARPLGEGRWRPASGGPPLRRRRRCVPASAPASGCRNGRR